MSSSELPFYLERYLRTQDYSLYTAEDQAVWRYILRQLTKYLSIYGHPLYIEGLAKTGIEVDRIPSIERMSEKLEKFGWKAVAVSGFIPPAAFMELQAYSYLPIACDMRTIDHLEYTPAPDIVHEAAGHAPILVDPEYASYLKKYSQVAKRAIISKWDILQYQAIREISDIKENPGSTPQDIQAAEKRLNETNQSIPYVSEAGLLSRMNWWTAEYGLIGNIQSPKIFGAGLLSSVGESKWCLTDRVKKIPLSKDCINYSYDITEPQPQLFVTKDFNQLGVVLDELGKDMSYQRGGCFGLAQAWRAQTVNTVELNSGIQIGGLLKAVGRHIIDNQNLRPESESDFRAIESLPEVGYLSFVGPTQLAFDGNQLEGHSKEYHQHGFGTPVGFLKGQNRCLSTFSESEVKRIGIERGTQVHLEFQSGVDVQGRCEKLTFRNGKFLILTLIDATVKWGSKTLFEPSWGTFDMAVGSKVISVFGGAPDRGAYGETEDFAVQTVPAKLQDSQRVQKHAMYREIRTFRESGSMDEKKFSQMKTILSEIEKNFPNDWLLNLEMLEVSEKFKLDTSWIIRLRDRLEAKACELPQVAVPIQDGIKKLYS